MFILFNDTVEIDCGSQEQPVRNCKSIDILFSQGMFTGYFSAENIE